MSQINFPKIAVIGANSYIGSALLCAITEHYPDAVGTSRRSGSKYFHLDINDLPDSLEHITKTGHTHAIIAIADPKIASCKNTPDASFKINVTGVLEIARLLKKAGVIPVFLSSDRVFDGCVWKQGDSPFSEESPVKADSVYGKQKILVENELKQFQEYLILRLSKVYGTTKGDRTMLDDIAHRLSSGRKVDPPYDQFFNPIHIDDLVRGALALIAVNEKGIFHLCSSLPCSRRELGLAMAKLLKKDSALVPIPPGKALNTPMLANKAVSRTGQTPSLPLGNVAIVAKCYIK